MILYIFTEIDLTTYQQDNMFLITQVHDNMNMNMGSCLLLPMVQNSILNHPHTHPIIYILLFYGSMGRRESGPFYNA